MSLTPNERQRLAEKHLGLVRSLAVKAKEGLPSWIELDDLTGYGNRGLMEAAARYDPALKVAFSTFAYYRIRGAIFDGVRESARLSRAEYARVRTAERVDDYLEQAGNQEAGADPVRRASRGKADLLRQVAEHAADITTIFVTSLDALDRPEVEDESAQQPFEDLDVAGLRPHLEAALSALNDRERLLIQRAYYDGHTLKDAADELGLTRSWASRAHARAIRKIRRYLAKRDPALL